MSEARVKYIDFSRSTYVPLFFRDYYLDAVCDAPWDVVLSQEGNKIRGAYVFMCKRKWGLSYIVQPKLCPYTGPLFFSSDNSIETYNELVRQLPKHHVIIQDFVFTTPRLNDGSQLNYSKHTYTIAATTSITELWNAQSSTHRRIIRKAENSLTYEEEQDIEVFLSFVNQTFKNRGKLVPNDPAVFRKLDVELLKRGQRKIVKCTDNNKKTVAMCYFMNDENWTYNFANSVVEDYRHYGMNLILWNEIKDSLEKGRSFDFEGSMLPGVDAFFKRFKGKRTHYPSLYWASNRLLSWLVKMKISNDSL